LAQADISVLVSRREGLPRAIMEAMAAGKPVVATDVRGSRELVDHGKTGYLVKLDDAEGLASALYMLINAPDLRQAMGKAGQKKIRDYSLDRVLQEMEAIYDRYLAQAN
ncbi:MAG: glycosyltransferase, partial [Moorella sp. (in: Bacteria)]|nr:glycosyltransferase [Moorella sp. (in: firmicutes)]